MKNQNILKIKYNGEVLAFVAFNLKQKSLT